MVFQSSTPHVATTKCPASSSERKVVHVAPKGQDIPAQGGALGTDGVMN